MFHRSIQPIKMKTENFDIHELIISLQGTCTMVDENLPEGMTVLDLTDEDYATIDNEIFLCDECGWWCENSEQNSEGNGLCNDCSPDE